jgi:hypothetical protein
MAGAISQGMQEDEEFSWRRIRVKRNIALFTI